MLCRGDIIARISDRLLLHLMCNMGILTKRRKEKHREPGFVPTMSGMSGYGPLEARALTAPAIFRRPPGDPLGANDSIWAGVANQPMDVQVSPTAHAAGPTSNGGTNGIASADIAVVDLINPGPPSAPVGTGSVNVSTTNQVTVASNGIDPISINAGSGLRRDWVIADTNTGNGPSVTVTEKFEMHFGATGDNAAPLPFFSSALVGPGLNVTATPFNVAINNLNFTSSVTGGSGPLTYQINIAPNGRSMDVICERTTNIGILPLAGTNPNGSAVGVPWSVWFTAQVGYNPLAFNVQATITSSYSIELS